MGYTWEISSLPAISYKPRKITCFHEQRVFVLYNCQIRSRRIFPRFVVENYERPFFNTFEFCLDGLQDFLSVSELYDGKVFSEKVKINEIDYFCECINDVEKTTVKITSPYPCVELEKIEDIVLRFVQLFTLVSYKHVYQAFRRIRLLTIVFIYQEFGLPLIYICKCIRNSFHSCVRNAELDRFVLAQIIDDIPLFDVDKETWDYFSESRIFSCFVYNPLKNLLELDKTTTELAWNKSLREREPFYENYVIKACPRYKKPVYQNTIFIICGSAHKEINGSFLLNYEDVPAVLKGKCEVQRTDLPLRRARLHAS